MTEDIVKKLRRVSDWLFDTGNTGYELETVEEAAYEIERLLSNAKSDTMWLASYHQWCKMNGCAPSSSDLIAASNVLKEKKDE